MFHAAGRGVFSYWDGILGRYLMSVGGGEVGGILVGRNGLVTDKTVKSERSV